MSNNHYSDKVTSFYVTILEYLATAVGGELEGALVDAFLAMPTEENVIQAVQSIFTGKNSIGDASTLLLSVMSKDRTEDDGLPRAALFFHAPLSNSVSVPQIALHCSDKGMAVDLIAINKKMKLSDDAFFIALRAVEQEFLLNYRESFLLVARDQFSPINQTLAGLLLKNLNMHFPQAELFREQAYLTWTGKMVSIEVLTRVHFLAFVLQRQFPECDAQNIIGELQFAMEGNKPFISLDFLMAALAAVSQKVPVSARIRLGLLGVANNKPATGAYAYKTLASWSEKKVKSDLVFYLTTGQNNCIAELTLMNAEMDVTYVHIPVFKEGLSLVRYDPEAVIVAALCGSEGNVEKERHILKNIIDGVEAFAATVDVTTVNGQKDTRAYGAAKDLVKKVYERLKELDEG